MEDFYINEKRKRNFSFLINVRFAANYYRNKKKSKASASFLLRIWSRETLSAKPKKKKKYLRNSVLLLSKISNFISPGYINLINDIDILLIAILYFFIFTKNRKFRLNIDTVFWHFTTRISPIKFISSLSISLTLSFFFNPDIWGFMVINKYYYDIVKTIFHYPCPFPK